jgi:hypothetical protein
MALFNKLPWLSLCLLLLAYIIFGKYLSTISRSLLAWGMAVIWGLVLAIALMNPDRGLRKMLIRWFKSDTVAFASLVGAAALASILLHWLKLFLLVFMMLAAESLARLDIQTAEYTEIQACVILTVTAWSGLGLGWALGHVL